jgi:hypothetical protein
MKQTMKGKMMGIPPSGEHTALTREEYMRLRDEEAKRPKGKRAQRRNASVSYGTWGSE